MNAYTTPADVMPSTIGGLEQAADAQPTLIATATQRIALASNEITDLTNELQRQADRIFGQEQSKDPSTPPNGPRVAAPAVVELSEALDRLNERINRMRRSVVRLRPVG